jgi:AraC-like DNA-binding protein
MASRIDAKGLHRADRHVAPLAGVELFTFESTRDFPRHSHDQYGFGVVLAGGHKSWSGRGEVEAVAGDVITVNPGEMHDGAPLGDGARRWRMIYLDVGRLQAALGDEVAGEVEFAAPQFRDPVVRRRALRLFAAADAFAFEAALTAAVEPMLARRRLHIGVTPTLRGLRERIDDDPPQRLTLAEMATAAGLSRFQLLRAFVKATGLTPQAYARQARARLARRLIRGGMELAEAASAAGFADQAHMTRALVDQYAVTPGRLR